MGIVKGQSSVFYRGGVSVKERFLRHKQVILHYYMATAIVLITYLFFSRSIVLLDREIAMILLGYLLLFPVVILYTRKYAVHVFLFILALITGFYSFYHYAVEEHSIFNALYFTFQLYLLTLTDVFTEDGSALLQYPFVVEIARWSAASYTIATLFIAMYRLLEMSIILTIYQVFGKHVIVFGYSDQTLTYIEYLRKRKERVLLIADQVPSEAIDYLEGLKVVVINSREDNSEMYTRAALTRAKSIMLMYEADMDNLNEYMDIYYYFKTKEIRREQLTVSIQSESYTSAKLLEDLERLKGEEAPYFNIQLLNPHEQLAEQMFERYPISSDEKDYLLIIGFNELGQQIASQAMKKGHIVPTIKVLDPLIIQVKKAWDKGYGKSLPEENIDFQVFDVMNDSLESLIHHEKSQITRIYVCLPEEHLDLWAVIELSNQFPHIPIYMSFEKEGIVAKWIQSETYDERLIYRIGTFEDLLEQDSSSSID